MALNRKVRTNVDTAFLDNLIYNNKAGAQKNMEVGRHLLPLNLNATTFTTDATTARALPSMGKCLAIYNSGASLGSITLGSLATDASLASGACDAAGRVGIPCPPTQWSYVACGEQTWVISSASTILVYLIDDESYLQTQ